MADTTSPQQAAPAVKGGMVPYLMVGGAIKAGEFYQKALGAEIALARPPDEQGRSMHVHVYVNGSSLMLSDAYPDHGCPLESAKGFNLMLVVDDIDAWWRRAIEAGAQSVMPVADMFRDDRYGHCAIRSACSGRSTSRARRRADKRSGLAMTQARGS